MDMKSLKSTIVMAVFAMVLMACGGDDDKTEDPVVAEGQTFRQTVMLPATAVDTLVTLTNLSAAISAIDGGEVWLSVTKVAYTSGAPAVRLTATANEGDSPRSCTVTITATSTDKVLLAVSQQQEPMKTGIDDLHSLVTDQPANSRGQ